MFAKRWSPDNANRMHIKAGSGMLRPPFANGRKVILEVRSAWDEKYGS